MKTIIVQNDNPMDCLIYIIDNFIENSPMYIETDLNNIDVSSDFFNKYKSMFKWHFNDSFRSVLVKMKRPLTKYEFSYYNRIYDYFGVNQEEIISRNFNNIICNWDSKSDYKNHPKPCLLTAKFIQEKEYIHLSITFRTRDIIKRLYPNWIALRIFFQKICDKHCKKMGKLFDFSNQIICDSNKRNQIMNLEEYINYKRQY